MPCLVPVVLAAGCGGGGERNQNEVAVAMWSLIVWGEPLMLPAASAIPTDTTRKKLVHSLAIT